MRHDRSSHSCIRLILIVLRSLSRAFADTSTHWCLLLCKPILQLQATFSTLYAEDEQYTQLPALAQIEYTVEPLPFTTHTALVRATTRVMGYKNEGDSAFRQICKTC